ncbi:hypothetical protein SAMN02745121_06086 [Nannocystis exedens]|uniref:Outer membrane protein beta-barrel domain-containing protein n=1 Tax=Nannocystis exedens TaxID=54 RepID=A0A1I2EHQ9_9BACT|nr:hypothetical protein NAEX_07833 [Nannocystis exedens]SFE91790.1 hypothetical protein SAMN02745121_06086 [Nannocystis exedens]
MPKQFLPECGQSWSIPLPGPKPPRESYDSYPAPYFIPGFRIAVGPGIGLVGDRSDRAHFALDALLFARVGTHRGNVQTAFFPTLGYSLGVGRVTREHLLVAGFGLGYVGQKSALALVPAFLFGDVERRRALGVRTSLLIDITRIGVVVEVAHQYLFFPDGDRQELRLMLGFDMLRIFR